MTLWDSELEKELVADMLRLEQKIDSVAPTPLRHFLNEQIVSMRLSLLSYKQGEKQ